MTEIPVVNLGGGVVMPMVGFGTWQLQGQMAYEATRHALQVGYRHIDTQHRKSSPPPPAPNTSSRTSTSSASP